MEELYLQIAPLIHLAAVGAAALWGFWELGGKPKLLFLFREQEHWRLWAAVLALMALGAILGFLSSPSGDDAALLVGFATIMVLMTSISLVVYAPACDRDTAPMKDRWKLFSFPSAGFLIVILAYSAGVFAALSWAVENLLGMEVVIQEGGIADSIDPGKPLLYAALTCLTLAAAAYEEILFRGALQPMLSRFGGAAGGIILSSFLWTFGHAGAYVTPHGLKEAHIFALGLLFGYLRWRYGLRAAIAAHMANNGAAMIFGIFMPPLAGE